MKKSLSNSSNKICNSCGNEQPLENYYARSNRPGSYQNACKECFSKNQTARRFARMTPEQQNRFLEQQKQKDLKLLGLKLCSQCKEEKPLLEYNTQTGIAKYSICKSCRPVAQREYLEANPEVKERKRKNDKLYRQIVLDVITPLQEAGCVDCGKYVPDAMEFDHTCPPEEKLYHISSIHTQGKASTHLKEMLESELQKGDFVCRNCHRIRTFSRHKTNRRLQYLADNNTPKLKPAMKHMYDFLSNSCCVDCKIDNFLVLEFDHVRGKKEAGLSFMVTRPDLYTLTDIEEEIAKCEIRCANCHAVETARRARNLYKTEQLPKTATSAKCECGKQKARTSKNCEACVLQKIRLITDKKYGNLEELLEKVRKNGFKATGKAYNVSGTAIKKYLKNRGIDIKTLSML